MKTSSILKRSWANLIPFFIIIASFGPYVYAAFGLRTEHVLIYLALLYAAPVFAIRRRFIILPRPLLGIVVLLLGITLWTLLSTILGNYSTVSFSKFLSCIENYIQPISVIILVLVFMKHASYKDYLRFFKYLCWCLVLMLCLNSILACASIFFDLSNFIRPFVLSCFGDVSVSQLAASMGRYSGIFNQPFESGLTYSLGLLSWGYLNRMSAKTGFIDYSTLFMLIVGGSLSVSKMFILGGIPLFILYYNPFCNFKKYFTWSFTLAVIISCCVLFWIIKFWLGLDYFCRLFKLGGGANIVELYSGGRYGAEYSTMFSQFARIWQESPFFGFGFGTTSCFDNGYLEFFLQGGIIALLGYFFMLSIYFYYSLRGFLNNYEEGRLLLAYFILVIGGNLGATVITINRFSTVFWVLTTVLFLMLQMRKSDNVKNRIVSSQTLKTII